MGGRQRKIADDAATRDVAGAGPGGARLRRLPILLLTPLVLSCCTPRPVSDAPAGTAAPTVVAPVRLAPAPKTVGTDAIPPVNVPSPVVHLGLAAAPRTGAGGAPAVVVTPGGEVTLNFTDADIREVVRAVVGDVLGLNYVVDAKLQGTVTVQTSKPLPREAVLPTLERVLRASGAAMVEDNGLIRVSPIDAAAKGTAAQPALGYAVRVLPLQYVTATELQKVLEPFVPAGAVLQVDGAHNVLVLSGSHEDMDSLAELVRSFDVDWLSRMSFALLPLRSATPEAIVSEMTALLSGARGTGEGAAEGMRLVPIERQNAVLVITAQPRYLDWARQRIDELDRGSEDGAERTFIYHVQHGRASDLADVLTRVFGSGAAGTPAATTRPSSNSSSYLQPLFGNTPSASTGGGLSSGLGSMSGSAAAPNGGLGAAAPLVNVLTAPQSAPTAPTGTSSSAPTEANPQGAQAQQAIRIVTDERNNALVVVTTPRGYRRVEEVLRRLDAKPLQVVIEATIAEVTLNDELQFGLQWFFRARNSSAAFTNVTTATPMQSFPGFSYLLSEQNVQVVLNALSSITNVNVVSSPQLLVLNNQTAQLQVGQQVPVPVQQQQSTVTPDSALVNTINYLNTGVILQVTPRANANGEVTLDIEQEVSDVATTTTGGLNAPTINERRIKSTVAVESGESVALGGLISNSVSKNRSAVPLLGDIPVLGALFRNDDNTTTRTELLVLIEPRIIDSANAARAATEDLERRMHSVSPIPPAAR